jgi:hypothetical protein
MNRSILIFSFVTLCGSLIPVSNHAQVCLNAKINLGIGLGCLTASAITLGYAHKRAQLIANKEIPFDGHRARAAIGNGIAYVLGYGLLIPGIICSALGAKNIG